MNGWHSLLEVLAHSYTSTLTHGVRMAGQEHIPPGPKIIVANHPDATAIFALPRLFSDRLCFLAQADLFDLPVVGRLLQRAGHVPVVRGQPEQTLALAQARLAQGYAIALCPEGRISPMGRLARAHIGAVRLALLTGASLVPVGCYVPPEYLRTLKFRLGGRERLGHWQVGGHCYLTVGPAWRPPASAERATPREVRQYTDLVWTRVAGLVEQARSAAHADALGVLAAAPTLGTHAMTN
jgi:1-acyl-sn-glycerol-3-phosphate acyltransferase